ncbi:hypothetical protein [Zobellia galactanivorans]|uniref:hypothetical protein n=1 Tax=Zobellia galactanivorans (strain DSM 12802 / CCUG 47099 / CIP 106680 / NCIMB 13871 / Dsij) TaxID=63186 RepID=UPI001C06B8C0|nr:hypothetical protein [Zobellia galactanivorans]MBU3028303.1 hypothetical protein [Zobellia galactanivorans]
MNVQDFTYLLQHPDKVVSPLQTKQLEDVLKEYPYFQAARALHLKGLKNLNSFKYNNALKVTAAYTTDRDVLFDFITSEEFLQNTIADKISGKTMGLADTETISEEVVPVEKSETPIPLTSADAEKLLDPQLFQSKDPKIDEEIAEAKRNASENLELGEPLPFTKREKYSFAEWLQLTTFKSVNRNTDETEAKENTPTSAKEEPKAIEFPLEEEILKRKKFELIDKFIAENPKIKPKKDVQKIAIETSLTLDKKELMTETLAKVYLEQKKYKKAIQSYKILSLKYPEKSGFFADRIKAVEKLQQENK